MAKKSIKKIIKATLNGDATVLSMVGSVNNIMYQNDDESVNRASAKFEAGKSIITFKRISERPGNYPKVNSLFQITAWDQDNIKADELKNAVVDLFNRHKNTLDISYSELTGVASDQYDRELNVWGIPMTFIFIYRDSEY